MPETFVVDAKGVIRFKHVGPLSMEDIAQRDDPGDRESKVGRLVPAPGTLADAESFSPRRLNARRTQWNGYRIRFEIGMKVFDSERREIGKVDGLQVSRKRNGARG